MRLFRRHHIQLSTMSAPSTKTPTYLVLLSLVLSHHIVTSYNYWDRYNGVVTASTAQNMDDLGLVLGPQYGLVVAAYWMYFTSTCTVIREKLFQDTKNGRMKYFCQFVKKCPILSDRQSCMIQEVVISIQQACCGSITDRNMGEKNKVTESPYQKYSTAGPVTKDPLLNGQRTCNTGGVRPSRRIIGGTDASRREFPWVAMLIVDRKFKCACTILDSKHAMTAAHCIVDLRGSETLQVIAGKYVTSLLERDPGQQTVYVSAYRSHSLYDRITAVNDIAILRLATPLTWSGTVLPTCLPPPGDKPADRCTVVGWGVTDGRKEVIMYPIVLQKVTLTTYSREECLQTFDGLSGNTLRNYVQEGTFCAANGRVGGKDACRADSGGPLLCIKGTATSMAYFQFGIVSNGDSCASPNDPGVYTDVTHYLHWINHTITELS